MAEDEDISRPATPYADDVPGPSRSQSTDQPEETAQREVAMPFARRQPHDDQPPAMVDAGHNRVEDDHEEDYDRRKRRIKYICDHRDRGGDLKFKVKWADTRCASEWARLDRELYKREIHDYLLTQKLVRRVTLARNFEDIADMLNL